VIEISDRKIRSLSMTESVIEEFGHYQYWISDWYYWPKNSVTISDWISDRKIRSLSV